MRVQRYAFLSEHQWHNYLFSHLLTFILTCNTTKDTFLFVILHPYIYIDKHYHAKDIYHIKKVIGNRQKTWHHDHAPRRVTIRLRRSHLLRHVVRYRPHKL